MNDYKDQDLKSALMFGATTICVIIGVIVYIIIN
jgi:hypothetical protein